MGVPRWAWRDRACVGPFAEPWLRDRPSLVRDVLLLYKPGACAAGPPEELEGDEGIQERCLLVAQGARREGRELALACAGRGAHCSQQGTGRLHRCQEHRSFQGRHLSLLSVYSSPRRPTRSMYTLDQRKS